MFEQLHVVIFNEANSKVVNSVQKLVLWGGY